jgi:hypothetical protein
LASLLQHQMLANVRYGSKADLAHQSWDVSSSPESGHQAGGYEVR